MKSLITFSKKKKTVRFYPLNFVLFLFQKMVEEKYQAGQTYEEEEYWFKPWTVGINFFNLILPRLFFVDL